MLDYAVVTAAVIVQTAQLYVFALLDLRVTTVSHVSQATEVKVARRVSIPGVTQ